MGQIYSDEIRERRVRIQPTLTQNQATTRREFVKKAVYVAPAVLSLKAAPSFAKTGSVKPPKLPKPPKKP